MSQIDPGYAANTLASIVTALKSETNPQVEQMTAVGQTPAPPPKPTSGGSQGSNSGSYTGAGATGNRDQDAFYTALLQRLGVPVTDANMTFMRAWNQAEGMDAGYYNPFATTQDAPGSRSLNSVGVRAYSSLEEGVNATAATLQNGLYGGILAGLASNDPFAAARGVANSPWGTGNLILQVLGASLG